MEVKEHKGIQYHLDDAARSLAAAHPTKSISGPQNLTGDFTDECALLPFLLTAFNTGTYWGFDHAGYQRVVDHFSEADRTNMAFAKGRVGSDDDLAELASAGHLRRVLHGDVPVYFVSEELAAKATNAERSSLLYR